jgi:hypothetical protein
VALYSPPPPPYAVPIASPSPIFGPTPIPNPIPVPIPGERQLLLLCLRYHDTATKQCLSCQKTRRLAVPVMFFIPLLPRPPTQERCSPTLPPAFTKPAGVSPPPFSPPCTADPPMLVARRTSCLACRAVSNSLHPQPQLACHTLPCSQLMLSFVACLQVCLQAPSSPAQAPASSCRPPRRHRRMPLGSHPPRSHQRRWRCLQRRSRRLHVRGVWEGGVKGFVYTYRGVAAASVPALPPEALALPPAAQPPLARGCGRGGCCGRAV